MINRYQFWATVFLSVALIVVFIGLFFFLVAGPVEAEIVKAQVGMIMNSFSQDITDVLSPAQLQSVQASLGQIKTDTPELQQADDAVAAANSALKSQAFKVLAIAAGILTGISVAIAAAGRSSISMGHLLRDSVGGLVAVAITYSAFLFLFARNFISADPNTAKLQIVEAIDKNTLQASPSATVQQLLSDVTVSENVKAALTQTK